MATTKFDTINGTVSTGDILVYTAYNGKLRGIKVLKTVFVDAVSEYRHIVQYGDIKDEKFVGDKLPNGEADVVLYTIKDIRGGFTHTWEPGLQINAGDVLKDQDGIHYLVESETQIWRLSTGTHASRTYWERDYGKKFTQVRSANGSTFSEAISWK
ncbi:hypothetical protein SEA_KUMQUAT_80 [Streptomyces phage Kumquat]|nr:hypothetical protein SEA_KUMQUAT_80 [Streptomyces phage Kumquat]